MTAGTSPNATFLHLSDLHFGGMLQNQGAGPIAWIGGARHDFTLLVELLTWINVYKGKTGKVIDLVLVTGDVTTSADPLAFEEVNNFLRWSKYVSPRAKIGLEMGEMVLIVPGNHDTWFTRLYISFPRQAECYKYLYFQSFPQLRQFEVSGQKFTFCLLDSNLTRRRPQNVSRGRVGTDQMNQVALQISGLSPQEKDFWESSIRIAMLHHHVYLPQALKEEKYTKMVDASEVLQALRNHGFHMVAFGHKHLSFHTMYPDSSAPDKILISAAGTACQAGQSENSFKVYEFRPGAVDVTVVVHQNKKFTALQPETYSF